jgi:hypothetical protein
MPSCVSLSRLAARELAVSRHLHDINIIRRAEFTESSPRGFGAIATVCNLKRGRIIKTEANSISLTVGTARDYPPVRRPANE